MPVPVRSALPLSFVPSNFGERNGQIHKENTFEVERAEGPCPQKGLTYSIPINVDLPKSYFENVLFDLERVLISGRLELPVAAILSLIKDKSYELNLENLKLKITLVPEGDASRKTLPVSVSTKVELKLRGASVRLSNFHFKDLELGLSNRNSVKTAKGAPMPRIKDIFLNPDDVAKSIENQICAYLNHNMAAVIEGAIQKRVDVALSPNYMKAGLRGISFVSSVITLVPRVCRSIWNLWAPAPLSKGTPSSKAEASFETSLRSGKKTANNRLNLVKAMDNRWFGFLFSEDFIREHNW